ncbi:E3 ubiquitin-protein ligase RBBP6-like isoform X2 [Oncorhynchus masou masou]|uniref:E3 ubiquitin-protein ligase RBBP6-like isoform X2 n=1 Tax=Oncorhynchus masou masou TaxID=90313 RepID=UPI0031832510
MSCVHYKFSSKLNYDTVTFDGLNITLADLKRQIMGRERLKAVDCGLQITNAQTKEEYKDDEALISKNSSVIIRRIPIGGVKATSKMFNIDRFSEQNHFPVQNLPVGSSKGDRSSEHGHFSVGSSKGDRSSEHGHFSVGSSKGDRSSEHGHFSVGSSKGIADHASSISLAQLSKTANLAEANASEDDKIRAMMSQSNHDYDPIHYVKKLTGPPPANYTCYRCGKNGHHIRNCPTNGEKGFEPPQRIKKSTGIPRSFMKEVDDPSIKGAMLTNTGHYAIPTIDAEAYALGKKERPPFVPRDQSSSEEDEDPVPDELLCLLCKDLMTDAVVIPCCGNSYCDDCIRTSLLESEEHVCPTCSQSNVSPDALIANKFLRQAVNNFKNETGYTKRMMTRGAQPAVVPTPPLQPQSRPQCPLQPIRSQQDPLMPRPPALDTPPLAQQQVGPPLRVGNHNSSHMAAGSSYNSTGPSPQHPTNHNNTLMLKEPESGGVQSVVVSADPPLAPMTKEYHVPVMSQPQSDGHSLQRTGPPPRLSEGPSHWDRYSPSGRGRNHSDRAPPSQPPPTNVPPLLYNPPSIFSSPLPHPPGVIPPHYPPPHFPPGQQPPSSYSLPPPGYPPTPGVTNPPWAPPNTQPPLIGKPIPSSSFLSKDEFYRQQKRLKDNSDCRYGNREKSKLDEFTNDFAKELLEYRKIQKERRRSYSRSRSSYSSSSYSKSRSRSRSYSRSSSRSRSRSRSHSRSYSRSSPYSRRHGRPRGYRSRSRGYRRSRSPPPFRDGGGAGRGRGRGRGYRSRSRSPGQGGYRSHTPPPPSSRKPAAAGPPPEGERKYPGRTRERDREPAVYDRGPEHKDPYERERYRAWEKEYREWYEKYFKNYNSHNPPPNNPPAYRGRPPLGFAPAPVTPPAGRDRDPYNPPPPSDFYPSPRHRLDRGSSPFSRGRRRGEGFPPPPSHPSPRGRNQPMTYQEKCAEQFGTLPLSRSANQDHQTPLKVAKGDRDPSSSVASPAVTVTSDLKEQKHRKRKKRKTEQGRGGGESFSASDSTDDARKEEKEEKKKRTGSSPVGSSSHDDSTPVRDEPIDSDASDSVPDKADRWTRDSKEEEVRRKSDRVYKRGPDSSVARKDSSSKTWKTVRETDRNQTGTAGLAYQKMSLTEPSAKRVKDESIPFQPDSCTSPQREMELQHPAPRASAPKLPLPNPHAYQLDTARINPDLFKPVRTDPDQFKPVRTDPDQFKPVRTDPDQFKPVRTDPDQFNTVRTDPDQFKLVITGPDHFKPFRTDLDHSRPAKEEQRGKRDPGFRQDRGSGREDKPRREADIRVGREQERDPAKAPDTKSEKKRRRRKEEEEEEKKTRKEERSVSDKEMEVPRIKSPGVELTETVKPCNLKCDVEEERASVRPLMESGMAGGQPQRKIKTNREEGRRTGKLAGVAGTEAANQSSYMKGSVERSKAKRNRKVLASEGPGTTVDDTSPPGGSSPVCGDGSEGRAEQTKTVVKTLEEYTNDSSAPADGHIVLIQVRDTQLYTC